MGLRFRKSVTLCKGVRLNFGMNGMSVTAGTKGFHNTYNFGTGRMTTSVGIPGTGLSYVTSRGSNRTTRSRTTAQRNQGSRRPNNDGSYEAVSEVLSEGQTPEPPQNNGSELIPDDAFLVSNQPRPSEILSTDRLKSIHYGSDDVIDWTEMLIEDAAPDSCEDKRFWDYCHEKAYQVLNGDIDTYLQIIQDVDPLDDLMDYGFGFECGTDDSNIMVVEFETKQDEIMPDKISMSTTDYYDLLQDYVCSCSVRVARDIFALLPVSHVIVHAVSGKQTILSVNFERRIFMKLKFQGSDASNMVEKFPHNMVFDCQNGFSPVKQLEG